MQASIAKSLRYHVQAFQMLWFGSNTAMLSPNSLHTVLFVREAFSLFLTHFLMRLA